MCQKRETFENSYSGTSSYSTSVMEVGYMMNEMSVVGWGFFEIFNLKFKTEIGQFKLMKYLPKSCYEKINSVILNNLVCILSLLSYLLSLFVLNRPDAFCSNDCLVFNKK